MLEDCDKEDYEEYSDVGDECRAVGSDGDVMEVFVETIAVTLSK